jgi:hypothetical protein
MPPGIIYVTEMSRQKRSVLILFLYIGSKSFPRIPSADFHPHPLEYYAHDLSERKAWGLSREMSPANKEDRGLQGYQPETTVIATSGPCFIL